MRLRAKLLVGIQAILLLQIVVTGGFTLRTLIVRTRTSTENELERDWSRVRSYVEGLKHTLYTDLYRLMFFLQGPQSAGASDGVIRGWIRSFIGFSNTDTVLLTDGQGKTLLEERAESMPLEGLSSGDIDPSHFRFPRNEFVATEDGQGGLRLFLVTGTTLTQPDGSIRHAYLITNFDKTRAEAINEKTGADIAFMAGNSIVASNTAEFSLDTKSLGGFLTVDIGNHPYELLPRAISYDEPQGIYLVSLRSLLPERLTVRPVLFSYLTAFLIALAASLFLATGMTMLIISPLSRLNQWLHTYMDSGTVSPLDIRSRDEVGFLAGAFHTMIRTLIEEKRVIGEQLEQIQFLNAYTQGIMNNIKAAIIVTGADESIEFCNTYFLELTRERFEDLNGARFPEILGRHFHLGAADRRPEDIPLDHEMAVDGLTLGQPGEEPRHFTAKISPIRLAHGRDGRLIVLEDITAVKRLWEKMMIADRVTSLGILSAGMAHEINNPLGSILSHVKYLKAVEGEQEKLDSLSWIESETNRIATIIKRIRAYSASPGSTEDLSDLNGVVLQTLEVLKFTLNKRDLKVSLALEESLPPVFCAPDELKQVVLNVVLNACQASANGGAISVATATVIGDGKVVLRVTDQGSGIEPRLLKNIFDPFFTTKASSEGTGLGLSICFAIVKRVSGDIRVRSSPGNGTEVEVTLNVHERAHRG